MSTPHNVSGMVAPNVTLRACLPTDAHVRLGCCKAAYSSALGPVPGLVSEGGLPSGINRMIISCVFVPGQVVQVRVCKD